MRQRQGVRARAVVFTAQPSTMPSLPLAPAATLPALTTALVALVVALTAFSLGCRRTSPAPAATAVERDRFPHDQHSEQACTDCHAVASVLSNRLAQPGQNDHQACDDAACHRDAFLTAPSDLCRICHSAIDVSEPGGTLLKPYPSPNGQRALASEFSHAQHLDPEAMERQVGFHISCSDCHVAANPETKPSQTGRMSLPGHDVCGRCHAPEAAPANVPTMRACQTCHQARAEAPTRARKLIVGDLRFSHQNHQLDRRGDRIRCRACHRDSAAAQVAGIHPVPATGACVACHDDSKRTASVLRMQSCATCHTQPRELLAALPPRSHLPARERPEDHTLAFRRDHSVEAEADITRCAGCHTFMSGADHSACDECHQFMRPLDHNLLWRDSDHGAASTIRPDRCSTCHDASFCWACHRIPPRSHFPRQMWDNGEHALAASLNLRSCLTCHDPDLTCARCHQLGTTSRPVR